MLRRMIASSAIVCMIAGSSFAQVTLEYKPSEGKTLRSVSTSKTHQTLNIAGNDVETSSDSEDAVLSIFGKRRDDGTLPIEIKLERVKTKLQLPGGIEIDIDTADANPKKIEIPQLAFIAEMFKSIAGTSYTVVLDAKNHVKFVEDVEKNLAKVGELSPEAVAGLKARFDADKIKREYHEALAILPDTLVREGDTWERTETAELGSAQTLTFKKQYEYKGTIKKENKTFHKVAFKDLEVVYTMDPNSDSPAKVTKSDIKIESSEGLTLIDAETGSVVERNGKSRMKGDMTMTINGQELPVKLDLTLESTTRVEPVAK